MEKKIKPTVESLLTVIKNLKSEHQKQIFKLSKENERLQKEISVLKRKSAEDERLKEKKSKSTETESRPKDNEYEVEMILADKLIKRQRHYLVRWAGFDESNDSWEPKRNIGHEALKEYMQSKK